MLPGTLIKGLDQRRLRNLLALLFVGLALPTAFLIWQAYSQLKWEAFHQHRVAAEELTRRVDSNLAAMIQAADARTFADYTFLVVSGERPRHQVSLLFRVAEKFIEALAQIRIHLLTTPSAGQG